MANAAYDYTGPGGVSDAGAVTDVTDSRAAPLIHNITVSNAGTQGLYVHDMTLDYTAGGPADSGRLETLGGLVTLGNFARRGALLT